MSNKVGIVIPSFNQGKFIELAIKSVIANKKYADIEIAVIDGGSSDETVDIIKKYQNDIVFWCSEPDGGQANAINKGIAQLSGCDYYMWLNSDDVFEDDHAVKTILDFMQNNSYEVAYGKSHFVDSAGNIIGEYPTEPYSYKKLGNRCFISQPSVMFSRKAYLKTGKINPDMKMCLDYEYWIRLAQNFIFGYCERFIGSTRMYGETKTSTMQGRHLAEAMTILMKYYNRVPMHWVVTYYRYKNDGKLLAKMNYYTLSLLLLPFKKKLVDECMEEF